MLIYFQKAITLSDIMYANFKNKISMNDNSSLYQRIDFSSLE